MNSMGDFVTKCEQEGELHRIKKERWTGTWSWAPSQN